MRDYSLSIYEHLLKTLLINNYKILSYENYLYSQKDSAYRKIIILRHDVDKLPLNSLNKAIIEHKLGVNATYYFRIVKKSNNPEIIKKIRNLGHEIGYHYEDLALANGSFDLAIKNFEKNLKYFNSFYPIKTICMHGSPLSKYDNKLIWQKIKYKDYGIKAEPYYDLDWNEFFYLTDTGMKWNAEDVSIRDTVKSKFKFKFKSTQDIIDNIEKLPDKIMINTHPQRWSNSYIFRVKEKSFQSLKNLIKKQLVKQNAH